MGFLGVLHQPLSNLIQITERFETWRIDSLLPVDVIIVFFYPSVKLEPDNLQYSKLCRLIVFGKFDKICKFEDHVTGNEVIMMSLQKQWKNVHVR